MRYASAITEQKKCWDGELLARKFDRFQTVRNNSQQHATNCNNMQHCLQTDVTRNIQQCWELLANNVASVCTRLNVLVTEDVSLSCFVFISHERAQTRERRASWELCNNGRQARTTLFTVLYVSVRSSRSSALRYGLPSCMIVKTT